jgi:hypothetical protein
MAVPLSDYIQLVGGYGDWLHGGQVEQVAREWCESGIDFEDCVDYIETGVFSPEAAQRLSHLGVWAHHLNHSTEDGMSIGSAYSYGLLPLSKVLDIVETNEPFWA